MPQENNKNLSIIIPVFNEINFFNKLFEQIKKYFNKKILKLYLLMMDQQMVLQKY